MSTPLAIFLVIVALACVAAFAGWVIHVLLTHRASTRLEKMMVESLEKAAKAYTDGRPGLAEEFQKTAELLRQRIKQDGGYR